MKKDPTLLGRYYSSDFDGKVSDIIAMLQKIIDKHPKATIESELDYGDCYYESDHPIVKFTIRSK